LDFGLEVKVVADDGNGNQAPQHAVPGDEDAPQASGASRQLDIISADPSGQIHRGIL
jgi:hypothetical protein